jgi:hypothetical protein
MNQPYIRVVRFFDNTVSKTTMQHQGGMTADIQQFFDAFCTAFSAFDGALIAQRYAIPYTSLNAEGRLQVFDTPEKIAQYFQVFLNMYYAQGCRACRFHTLHVMPLGHMSAVASVTWELLRDDHRIVSRWRESYNLMKCGNQLLIYASTDHVDIESRH